MMTNSPLATQNFQSPLAGQSTLKPKGFKGQREFFFSLSLTSLIDAFSILVIYLLMNFSATGEVVKVEKDMQLPKAASADTIERGIVVRVSAGHYFVEDQLVSANALTQALLNHRPQAKEEAGNLIIQADRRLDYSELSPVLQAGAHAGFQKFKFAVIQDGARQ
jgi:biopolymer transport protein ExbD